MRPFKNLENKTPADTLKSSASMYEMSGSQFTVNGSHKVCTQVRGRGSLVKSVHLWL